MNKRKYKTIGLYDARKYAETGNGQRGTTIKIEGLTPKQIEKWATKIKDKQKLLNKQYKDEKRLKLIESRPKPTELVLIQGSDPFKVHTSLNLKLDPGTGNTTFILGASKAGKSTTLMWIYDKYYANRKYISILFSINKHIKLYKKHKLLLKCPSFNKQSEKLVMMEKYINMKCNNKYHFVNMFDDILNVRHNKLLNNLILTYRNSNISSLVSLQYSNLLSKQARSNINNVLLFSFGSSDEAIEVAIRTFLRGIFTRLGYKTISDQLSLYRQLTQNHGFIYLHPSSGHFSVHRLNLR